MTHKWMSTHLAPFAVAFFCKRCGVKVGVAGDGDMALVMKLLAYQMQKADQIRPCVRPERTARDEIDAFLSTIKF